MKLVSREGSYRIVCVPHIEAKDEVIGNVQSNHCETCSQLSIAELWEGMNQAELRIRTSIERFAKLVHAP